MTMPDVASHTRLSARERQVLHLAVKGFANKIIARRLNLAEGTVKVHLHNIYHKLDVPGRIALVLAFRQTADAMEDQGA
jgi:two-component system, NarL family, nitrate/nitrite response regulator NarL